MSIEDVKILSTSKLTESIYIQPMRVKFIQDGKEKKWDYIKTHDSVAILICNITSQEIVLVRQFRPAVYMAEVAAAESRGSKEEIPGSCGVTYELCAGLVDREDRVENIACSEVLEETGYKVTPDMLEFISKFRSNVGVAASLQQMFYVEVTNDMKVSEGGGSALEGEMIELHHIKFCDVKSFLEDQTLTNRPSGLLLALSWFLVHKARKFKL